MPRRLRGWLALNGRERAQFLGLAAALAVVHASLALVGYVRTRRWVERLSAGGAARAATADDLHAARRLARLAEIAGRRGAVRASCLRQALVLHGWLRRRGLNPEIVIGVRRDGGAALDAHAWVALDGASIDAPSPAGNRAPASADAGKLSAGAGSAPARPTHAPLRRAGARTSADGSRG
jgi:hypothetical protein